MNDFGALPPSVLVKIAQLEGHCLTLTTRLEHSRKELQRLRIELRDLVPREVHDEYEANRESERLIAENRRLETAIAAQIALCERQERRLRAEEAVIRSCKQYLHDLPADARLRVVEAKGGDLTDIRARIAAVKDEIAQVGRMPVPSADLPERIKAHVGDLASKARPVISGVGAGPLGVHYPVRPDANRITLSGFSDYEGNTLLLLALGQPERLAERLLEIALDGSISQGERDKRLRGLQEQLTRLRYDEEAAITEAINKGADVYRSASEPWAVLQVQMVEHQRAAA